MSLTSCTAITLLLTALLLAYWSAHVPPIGLGGDTSCNNPVDGLLNTTDGFPFTCGLHRVGHGELQVYAYIQPNGSWCWSNSGLVVNAKTKESVLVDTLTDERLTRKMLSDMEPILNKGSLKSLIHTHGDIDHVYGNGVVADQLESINIAESGVQMLEKLPNPQLYGMMIKLAQHIWFLVGDVGNVTLKSGVIRTLHSIPQQFRNPFVAFLGFLRAALFFQPFMFSEVTYNYKKWEHLVQTFEGSGQVKLGDESIEVIQTKPSHSYGDTVVLIRSARTVFTGDLLLGGSSPIMWHGPAQNFINSLDFLLSLPVDYYIPGHGPVFRSDFVQLQREYWEYVQSTTKECYKENLDSDECGLKAMNELPSKFRSWGDRERMLVNVWVEWNHIDTDGHFKIAAPEKMKQLMKMGMFLVKQELPHD